MADEQKSRMGREVIRGLDRMAEAIIKPFNSAPGFRREFPNISILIAAISILAVGWVIADLNFFSFDFWKNEKGEINKSEVFRNLSLAVIALVGLGFGIWRAWTAYLQTQTAQKQAEIAEQGLFTERFSKATEQLGSEELSVRLGGIYALWRLAEDSAQKDAKSVFDILCAFVRDPTPDHKFPEQPYNVKQRASEKSVDKDVDEQSACRPDVQAILDLIGSNQTQQRNALAEGYVLDLHGAALRGANLSRHVLKLTNFEKADLSNSNLSQANFEGANLIQASFKNSILWHAKIEGADLMQADFESAKLLKVDLRDVNAKGAHFGNASLVGANLANAIFEEAIFKNANLKRAILTNVEAPRTDFENADLQNTHLEYATFAGARFKNANLLKANCENAEFWKADFENANLQGAILEYADLNGAVLKNVGLKNAKTKGAIWPKGFTPPDDIYDYDDDEESYDDT